MAVQSEGISPLNLTQEKRSSNGKQEQLDGSMAKKNSLLLRKINGEMPSDCTATFIAYNFLI